jgi:hypothetical protein
VGLVGTLYIVFNFRQQTKINRQQQYLNKLVQEKHRREIRPYFQIKTDPNSTKDEFTYLLYLTNAIALAISIYSVQYDNGLETLDSEHNAWVPEDEPVVKTDEGQPPVNETVILKKIIFTDEEGRVYCQLIKRKGNSVYTTLPQF